MTATGGIRQPIGHQPPTDEECATSRTEVQGLPASSGPRRRETGRLFCEARDIRAVVAKIVPKPERKGSRLSLDAPVDLVAREQRDVGDLGGIRLRLGHET